MRISKWQKINISFIIICLIICNGFVYAEAVYGDRLEGILYSEDNPKVIIGGESYAINETIGDYKIILISSSKVTIESQGEKKEFMLGQVVIPKVKENAQENGAEHNNKLETRQETSELSYQSGKAGYIHPRVRCANAMILFNSALDWLSYGCRYRFTRIGPFSEGVTALRAFSESRTEFFSEFDLKPVA